MAFFGIFNEKGMQMDQYSASRSPWLETYKKFKKWNGGDSMPKELTVFPECFAVVLGDKSTGRELASSKGLSLAKISDLVEIIVVNGQD